MRKLREAHLYLGCIFTPLIIYFSISGAWQAFRFNDLPKNAQPSAMQSFFHELSKPHTNSTMPGLNPKEGRSLAFSWIALITGFGIAVTSAMGVILALKFGRSKRKVAYCLGLGLVLPALFLALRI